MHQEIPNLESKSELLSCVTSVIVVVLPHPPVLCYCVGGHVLYLSVGNHKFISEALKISLMRNEIHFADFYHFAEQAWILD